MHFVSKNTRNRKVTAYRYSIDQPNSLSACTRCHQIWRIGVCPVPVSKMRTTTDGIISSKDDPTRRFYRSVDVHKGRHISSNPGAACRVLLQDAEVSRKHLDARSGLHRLHESSAQVGMDRHRTHQVHFVSGDYDMKHRKYKCLFVRS